MNDTPETDAAIKDQSKWMRPFVSTTFDGITYDSPVASLCRKLERERDKARTELEMWRDGNIMHQIHRDELEKVEQERDEAREALRTAVQERHDFHWELLDAVRERDEAITRRMETIMQCELYEQERDEARTELEMWRDGNILHEVHRNELEKTERERDEAREQIDDYRERHDLLPISWEL
jgi:hypothetical protein